MPSGSQSLEAVMAVLPDITHRKMMGEYLLYLDGVLFGGIYDDRLLLKPLPAFRAMLPDAPMETPYPGAKPMLLVEDVENGEKLREILAAIKKAP